MRLRVGGWAEEPATGILVCLLAAAPVIIGRSRSEAQNIHSQCAGTRQPAQSQVGVPVQILREIKDPHSGARWLIIRNAKNPAGPALIAAETESAQTGTPSFGGSRPPSVVIHAGDRVVVEEHTPAAESYLEAVALGTAAPGAALDVRLKIGGKVVRAVAIAPGRAALAPSREVRP